MSGCSLTTDVWVFTHYRCLGVHSLQMSGCSLTTDVWVFTHYRCLGVHSLQMSWCSLNTDVLVFTQYRCLGVHSLYRCIGVHSLYRCLGVHSLYRCLGVHSLQMSVKLPAAAPCTRPGLSGRQTGRQSGGPWAEMDLPLGRQTAWAWDGTGALSY